MLLERGKGSSIISCNSWLLTKDYPIINFEAMRLLFTTMCKHWNDNVKWDIAKVTHYIILITTKIIIHCNKVLFISCDEVMTIDNESRVSVHIYLMEDFEHILILLNLENWLVMAHPITLLNVIMNLLLIYGGLTMKEINGKPIWFGFYGITMFTSVHSDVTLGGTFFFEFINV